MSFKRLRTMIIARNREFFRDRAAFGWNFIFPFLIIAGFSIIFGDESRNLYKVGVFPQAEKKIILKNLKIPGKLKKMKYMEFIGFQSHEMGIKQLKNHRIDLLIESGKDKPPYWVNSTSPNGYIAEQILKATLATGEVENLGERKHINGVEIKYIDWLFPGILAMNMMFSSLWGVGYIIVRYRKNGVLKKLKATPLTAFEYLSAQMLSRIFVLMFSLVIVWVGCDLIFKFHMAGSYLNIFILFFAGGCSLTSLGLLVASRGISEEFTSGILNFITWPMMFLSEVWFSLEGAPEWVKGIAKIFPLTHMNQAIRKIMSDGAGLMDVGIELSVLIGITVLCLVMGAWLFSWDS